MLRSTIWRSSWACAWLATLALAGWSLPANAQSDPQVDIAIPATTLPAAIAELSREARVSIGAPGALPRIRVNAISGRQTVAEALSRLLAGSGYVAKRVGRSAWRIERAPLAAPQAAPATFEPADIPASEIVVTGAKRAQLLQDTPNAVSVYLPASATMGTSLDGTGAVARGIEGLTVMEQGSGQNRIFLRGVADSAFGGRSQSTVAILLDDARLTYSAPDPDIRLVDVDRVEVLKGPQGSLYGTGALGGIYRVVTNRADLDYPSVAVSAGSTAVASGNVGFEGSVIANLPLARDVAGVRLVAYGERTPGWLDTGDRRDANAAGTIGLRGTLGIEPGSGWRIDAGGMGQWQNSRDSGYVYAEGLRIRPAQLPEPHDSDLVHGYLHTRYDGTVTLVFSSGYTDHEVTDRFDATEGAETLGLADPEMLEDASRFTVWDSEFRANGFLGKVAWIGGISHVESKQRTLRTLKGRSGTVLDIDRERRASVETALFGEASFPLFGRLEGTVGGRMFLSRIEDDRTVQGDEGDRHLRRLGFTPSGALAWRIDDGQMAYLRYGSAFRQGALTLEEDGTYEPLDGDELATLSAGWRGTTGNLTFEAGMYRSWWHSVQSDVLRQGGLIETENVGDGSILGAEATVAATIDRNWRLEAGAVVQSAMLDPEDAEPGQEDLRLPVVPDATFRVSLTRDFYLGGWNASGTARLLYIGTSRLSFDPALDRKIDARWDTLLRLSATRGRLTLDLEAQNLFDSRSDVSGYGNPLRLFDSTQYVPQTPRRIRLAIGLRG